MADVAPLHELIDAANKLFWWSHRTFRGWNITRQLTPAERRATREEKASLFDRFKQSHHAAKSAPVLNYVSFDEWREHLGRIEGLGQALAFINEKWFRENPRPAEPMRDVDRVCYEDAAGEWFLKIGDDFQRELGWWIDLSQALKGTGEVEAAPAGGGETGGKVQVDPSNATKPKHKNVNARMLETIQRDHEAVGWTARQWAEHLQCSKSAVTETKTWRAFKNDRTMEKAERRAGSFHKTKDNQKYRR